MPPSRRKGSKAAAAAAAGREWKVGDLVLAKVKGFQAWPAMVSEPEKWGYAADWKKVLVCFFGTQEIAFCNPADVEAFTEEKKQRLLGKRHGKHSDFGRALIEIIDTFEKLKKQNECNNYNDRDAEEPIVSEHNTSEVLKIPVSFSDKSPKSLSSGTEIDANGKSRCDGYDMNGNDVALKEDGSVMTCTERSIITTYLTRRRSQRTHVSKSSLLRQHSSSARHSRSSSRGDIIELRNVSEPSGKCVNKSIRDVPSSLRNMSAGRKTRMRKTPDFDDFNEVDSPDVVSNCSTEGNDFGIVTADSADAVSFNEEGSTTEQDFKGVLTDLVQRNIDFSQRLEFQTNIIIHKKKRKLKRITHIEKSLVCTKKLDKRVASDSDVKIETIPEKLDLRVTSESDIKSEETILGKLGERVVLDSDIKSEETILGKLGERVVLDSDIKSETIQEKVDERVASDINVKSETVLRSDHDRRSKENGDEHLPPSKRARARICLALSTCEELHTLQDSEKKMQEESHIFSDQVSQSLHLEVDNSIEHKVLLDNGDADMSSPLLKHPEDLPLPPDSSLDVEVSLPACERSHGALGILSVNASEDKCVSVDKPLTKMTGQNCSSFFEDLYNATERRNGSELGLGKEDDFSNKNSVDGPLESLSGLDMLIAIGRAFSAERTNQTTNDSPRHNSPEDGAQCSDTAVFVERCKSLSPDICEQGGSPCAAMSSDDQCKTTRTLLTELSAEINRVRSEVNCDVIFEDNINGLSVLEDSADDSCKTTKSSDLTIESCKVPGILNGGDEMDERGSERSSFLAHSNSVSDDQSLDKSVSVSQSSSSLTDGLDYVSHATPHTLAGNTLVSDNIAIQFNGSCSPGVHSNVDAQKRASKWKNMETQDNLASFTSILGTLTRGKESIVRATRLAIELSKYGVAAKVVEIIACNLEKESSLHRRVDLFFLVDSIAQSSKGLRGDFAGVYPSAILAVLPRLLSAAAPPGSSSRENRRQCLKVLRVWLERRILPESIILHHIRELDSICGSFCSRTSSRAYKKERPSDDPVREMEGMLVDEYGSNSSLQFPGFCMPSLIGDEDNGVDSDGESFEALTPEHNAAGESEVKEGSPVPVVDKHRHILEAVDGELEMEDVAPMEVVAKSNNLQMENSGAAVVVHPLPVVVPLVYPPLPTSPPPPPLPPLPPALCPDSTTSNHNSMVKGFRLPPPHPAPSNHFSYVQNEPVQTPHLNSNRLLTPNTDNGSVYTDCERTNFPPYGVQEHWRAPPQPQPQPPFPGPNYPNGSGNPYEPAPFGGPQHREPPRLGFHSRGMNHQEFMHHGPPSGAPIPVSARGVNFWRPR